VNDRGLSYFEDYLLGATYQCGSVSIDQASIVAFAKEFDPQPFHVDPAAAAAGPYGGLIASGWHTAALVMRLLVENFLAAESSLGSAGLDELRWPHPVAGDTLRHPGHGCRVPSVAEQTRPRHRQRPWWRPPNTGGATVMRATRSTSCWSAGPGRLTYSTPSVSMVGVVVGDLLHNPRAPAAGAPDGVRLQVEDAGAGAERAGYSARPIRLGQPLWRADLLESVSGPAGGPDRAPPRVPGWSGRRAT
jgi:hypothetical protein